MPGFQRYVSVQNRIECYFSISVRYQAWTSAHLEARQNSPGSRSYWQFDTPIRRYGAYTARQRHYGNGATERQRGQGFRKRLRKRIRMNRNLTLEARH